LIRSFIKTDVKVFGSIFSGEVTAISFMPHGHCYFWTKNLIFLHSVSDILIFAAYFSIPVTLVYFVRKRADIPFHWIFVCFALFILACGTTHLMEVWNIWHANYWISGSIKAITALASVPTAIALVRLMPHGLALPSPSQLTRVNAALESEIEERKQVEDKLRATIGAAHSAVVTINHDGRITEWNKSAEHLFGWTAKDIIGRRIVDTLIPPQYRQAHENGFKKFLETREGPVLNRRIELTALRCDQTEFAVELTIAPIRWNGSYIFTAFIRDISERKRYEEELQEKNVEMEKAIVAKDRFLASMSHELRTPLNAILGFTGTLLMELPGPLLPKQKQQLEIIKSSARHQLWLINDLLDLAKIESGKVELNRERIVCSALVNEVAETLRPLAEQKGLQFTINAPDFLAVNTDRRALSQILINLVNNAIKFTDAGEVRMEVRSQNGTTEISVTDTGVGIKPEDQAKLFNAFARLESGSAQREEGTGLGLHLSQKLAGLLGGRITFQSEPGKGSIFAVKLSS
jgi:PAS domain S-box-containing protein